MVAKSNKGHLTYYSKAFFIAINNEHHCFTVYTALFQLRRYNSLFSRFILFFRIFSNMLFSMHTYKTYIKSTKHQNKIRIYWIWTQCIHHFTTSLTTTLTKCTRIMLSVHTQITQIPSVVWNILGSNNGVHKYHYKNGTNLLSRTWTRLTYEWSHCKWIIHTLMSNKKPTSFATSFRVSKTLICSIAYNSGFIKCDLIKIIVAVTRAPVTSTRATKV